MSIERQATKDGSWTCFNTTVQEHYHNIAGAYTESMSIYVEPVQIAKHLAVQGSISILDPFFGLGYNTFACIQQFRQLQATQFPDAELRLISFEIDPEIIAQIPTIYQSGDLDNLKSETGLLQHNVYYQTQQDLSLLRQASKKVGDGVHFELHVVDVRQGIMHLPDNLFDVILHDAFSPRKQPELWTVELFQQYHRVLNQNGFVLTYGAAAGPRTAMRQSGFYVGELPNAVHKPGTVAFKNRDDSWPALPEKALGLMQCRSGLPYRDSADLDLSPETIMANRDATMAISKRQTSSEVHRLFSTP